MGWNLAPSEGNYDLYNKLPDHLWLRGSDGQYCVVDHKASQASRNWSVSFPLLFFVDLLPA